MRASPIGRAQTGKVVDIRTKYSRAHIQTGRVQLAPRVWSIY
jgi:hypothetical protein